MSYARVVHYAIFQPNGSKKWELEEVVLFEDTFRHRPVGIYDTWDEARGVFLWRIGSGSTDD
jgi:hypothetical protein